MSWLWLLGITTAIPGLTFHDSREHIVCVRRVRLQHACKAGAARSRREPFTAGDSRASKQRRPHFGGQSAQQVCKRLDTRQQHIQRLVRGTSQRVGVAAIEPRRQATINVRMDDLGTAPAKLAIQQAASSGGADDADAPALHVLQSRHGQQTLAVLARGRDRVRATDASQRTLRACAGRQDDRAAS